MAINTLTETSIRKIKPTSTTHRLFDGGGLYLEIAPSGGKWWRQKYRFMGKEKRLAHGTYPDVGLAEAREKRDQARRLLAAGVDPGEHRKATRAAKEERAGNSLEAVKTWGTYGDLIGVTPPCGARRSGVACRRSPVPKLWLSAHITQGLALFFARVRVFLSCAGLSASARIRRASRN